MKKFINAADRVVEDSLAGMAAAHHDLIKVHYEPNFITRAGGPVKGKVAIVSGGGSGHEPMHGGFVGRGMLHAACPGAVFTSPTPDQMLAATKAVDGGTGVLHIVKNYTGDILNFEMAADLAKEENIHVNAVVTDDDVAVQDSLYTAGRRGVGGTVLAEKICGAAAEAGADLETVTALCRKVNASVRSIGVALSACTVPHAGKPSFTLEDDEIEFGIGIHGEPGRRRAKHASADELAAMMMEPILTDLPFTKGDHALLFVNGMGGTPLIELYVLFRKAHAIAAQHGVTISRSLVGSYITSLEMAGASISLLRLDDSMTKYWDAPVVTPALRWGA
ncbi:MAG: dihydroxyacetone kinase subunit DhaK [Rhodospirillales bacterium 20-60-12]|nr:MAG: dihydroxyacetone kinase subunit DhaK [Rhodospirillales bacterium 20-60-12]HQT66372.1 dihydroxyacetone kinase subunit DhaK [Acetobacteraceae bacterium]